MDLVFIDGGKSYDEAQSDWENSRRLLHEGSAVYVHNYEFYGVRRMVEGVSRSEYEVQLLSERGEELVTQIRKLRSQP